MHDKPTGARETDRASTAALDLRDQGVILVHVLALHPAHLRVGEMIREVSGGSADFGDQDRFERAVGELVGIGLLARSAELVLATRAAIRFNEIASAGI
jgi:hypothetical protein